MRAVRKWPWAAVWRVACTVRFRYRDQLWPVVILGVLAVAGVKARSASPPAVAVLGVLGCGAVLFHLRSRLTRRVEWGYALCCLSAAMGWLIACSLTTGARWVSVTGMLVWAGLSLPWWRHHEVRGGDGRAGSAIAQLWNEHIRDGKGPMAGAELEGPVPFEHGDTYTVRLVPYKQTLGKAQADLPNWTTALDTPMQHLLVEQHPDYPRSPRYLRLQVITRSPIEHTVYFDRPRHEDGRILLGPHADGIGEAALRLYTENSMWGGYVLGGIGSGKTRLEEIIALSVLDLRAAGQHTVIFYIDGQDGASSPTLFQNATWAVGAEGAMRMLAALERIAAYRNRENRANGWSGFTPSAARPGILTIIDEAHVIFPQAAQRWSDAARTHRKLGLAYLAASQDSNLKTFGGEDALRSALLAGNGLVLRVNSRIAGNLIPGLELNPFDLPILPGYAVSVGAPGSDIRTAPFRGRYAPDDKDAARAEAEGATLPVPTVEEWFSRYEPLELDRGARRAAGSDYTRRHERAEQEREELRELVNAGLSPEDTDPGIPLPTPAAPSERLPVSDRNVSCAERILALDWARYRQMEVAQVMAETGQNLSTVRKALNNLVSDGQLERDDSGKLLVYRRAGA